MIHAEVDIIREAYNNGYLDEVARTSAIPGKNEFNLITNIINRYLNEKISSMIWGVETADLQIIT